MTPHELLLKSICERQEKLTEFNQGILTADRYVKTISECVGSDLCYRFAAKGNISFQDIITKAAKVLTYNNTDMVVEDLYGKDYTWRDKEGETLELPKNTLMVFKHVLTTPRKDRDGDIMRTQGALLDPKMLLLWQHVHTLPIGKLLVVSEHNSKKLTVISAIVDMNELSHDAAVMVDNRMGRFSHGFKAIEFDKQKEGGFDVKRFEIMEESLVSIPSNVDSDTEEILLSLVEGGKLTSVMMKNVGKSIRTKMPKQFAGGTAFGKVPLNIDLNVTINGKALNEGHTADEKTACTGGQDCGCGCGGTGAPEKTNAHADDKKNTDDKEVMLCPKCGNRMLNGKCSKCGYIIEKSATDDDLNDGDKDLEESLENNEDLDLDEKGGPGSGPRPSGKVNKQLAGEMATHTSTIAHEATAKATGNANGSFASREAVRAGSAGNHLDSARIHREAAKDHEHLASVATDSFAKAPHLDAAASHKHAAEFHEHAAALGAGNVGKSANVDEKAGKRISAKSLEHLNEAHDSIQEVHQNEHMMTRGGKALCEKAMGHMKSVMGSGMNDLGETSAKPKEKTISEFLATADYDERQKMRKKLDTLDSIDEMKRNTKEFRELTGK